MPVEIELPCRGVDFQRRIVTPPAHGTLGDIDQQTGKVTYTAASGYFTPKAGPPDGFTFRATNRGGDGAPAKATVTVDPPAPTCEATVSVDVDFETARSITPACKGEEIEYAIGAQPGHGKLGAIDRSTGAVTYTPDKGYYSPISPAEPDSFTITATNRSGKATTTIRARVLPPPPTCDDAKLEVNYSKPGTVEMTCRSVVKMTGVAVTENPRNGTLGDATTSSQGNTLTARWTYTPKARFAGDDSFKAAAIGFEGKRGTPGTGSIKVNQFKFRAIGDSVTAGFGYYSDGSDMSITKLFACKPGDVPNDRCSSNSPLGNDSEEKVKYTADWGLKNNVAWPAQYANRLGLKAGVEFKNLAVTGSEPENWAPGGYLNSTLEEVVAENPDMVVMTIGANPLLSMFLLSKARFQCGWTFTESSLKTCVEGYITSVKMDERMTAIFNRLLDAKDTRVVVSLYPQVAPALGVQPPLLSYSPWQLDYIEKLINDKIVAVLTGVASKRGADRLLLSRPERTYVGLWSYYADNQTCGVPVLHSRTDGYSRQGGLAQTAIVSQVAAYAAPWFSWMLFPPAIAAAAYTYAMTQFCPSTTYWTIEGDTGIHPSRAGHKVFADALEKVANDNKLVPPLP